MSSDSNAVSREDEWKKRILGSAFSRILDMPVEYRLHADTRFKPLSAAQFISIHAQMSMMFNELRGYRQYVAATPKDQLPPALFATASNTIDCANALFIDRLLGGNTNYFCSFAEAFDGYVDKGLAERMCDLSQGQIPGLAAGDEYGFVDAVMGIAGLSGCYQWHRRTESEGATG